MNYFNYYSEIEETFNRRRGKYQFLSPVDWALMESWERRGVPLHVVLRGIEKVFDSRDAKPNARRTIKGLSYCREEIEAQYEEWLERQIGKSPTESSAETSAGSDVFAEDSIRVHLETAAAQLETARREAAGNLRAALERACARLAEIAADNIDAESLEKSLSDLEKMIDDQLLAEAAGAEYAELNAQISKNLVSYKSKMEAEVYRQTFDLMLLKALRERAGIPRLSLFYL